MNSSVLKMRGVIPAQAGIHFPAGAIGPKKMGSRLRGNDTVGLVKVRQEIDRPLLAFQPGPPFHSQEQGVLS